MTHRRAGGAGTGGGGGDFASTYHQISDLPVASHPLLVHAQNSTAGTAAVFNESNRMIQHKLHYDESFRTLSEFRQSGFLCDVEIKVDEKILPAHRVVLAACIPYFHSMFASEMIEARLPRIEIKDIAADAMECLINFAYTATLSINQDNVQQMLYAGSILQMDSVCRACEDFLQNYLTTMNCLAIRAFAQQHNCVQLMQSVDSFALEHFELTTSEDFVSMTFGHLLDLISSADLNISAERKVYDAVIAWVGHEPETRCQYLGRLLSKVRLCQLEPGLLLNTVKSHPWIRSDAVCSEIVSNAMACQMVMQGLAHVASSSQHADFQLCRPRKSFAGVIFCVGGRGTSGDPFRSIEAYDARQNRWISVAEMGVKRRHVGVVAVNGKLFAIGGHDGHEHLCTAEMFDPRTNTWRLVSSMESHRRGIAVGSLGGAIYAVGGLDDSACFHTVERYDIEADKWSYACPMNVQRGGVGVAALRGHLYAVGGNDGSSSLDSCERFDPHLNKWTLVASMSHRRAGAGVAVLEGFLYAIGGFDDNSPLNSCERYNPQTNEWSMIPQMSCSRGGVGVAALGGRLFAVGGHDGISYLSSVEAYDPFTNRWESVAGITQCRAGAGVTWCQCSIDMLQPMSAVNVASCV